MNTEATCPRCGGRLRAPNLWSSAWECAVHGGVHPFVTLHRACPEALAYVRARTKVPLWCPWPLPASWVVSGLAYAGDERTGARASVLACSGGGPLGGPVEAVFVAEEPGIGLGARYAGLAGADPGEGFDAGAPHAKVEAAGHPTPLWALATPQDCAVFVGEAKGVWLWTLVWPGSGGVICYDDLALADLAASAGEPALDFGSLSPRLTPPAAGP